MRKKRILIFEDKLGGHHLEYINHLHKGATENKEFEFIFALPASFEEKKKNLIWKESDNIRFHYIPENNKSNSNKLKQSFDKSMLVRQIALLYSVDEVFLLVLMSYIPAIVFTLPKCINISGVIYLIYLYRWKNSSLVLKILDSLKYILLSRRKNIKSVFILNDKSAVVYLNKKFNTSKFTYLPDPFIPLPPENIVNLKSILNIPKKNKVILHFGSMTQRKGSINILKAIDITQEEYLKDVTFIFAGVIKKTIKEQFYSLYKKVETKSQLIVIDGFCKYEYIASLCYTCDYILIPYLNTNQSSGVIGYANQFQKPVVAPNKGLLGKLVKRNRLGILLPDSTIQSIADFLKKSTIIDYKYENKSYISKRNIDTFNNAVFKQFN